VALPARNLLFSSAAGTVQHPGTGWAPGRS
jgi:hypothetical protein